MVWHWCYIWLLGYLLDFLNYQSYYFSVEQLTSHEILLRQITEQSPTAEQLLAIYRDYDFLSENELQTLLGTARKN